MNPGQAAAFLVAVSFVGRRGIGGTRGERLVAFFGCLYFAGLRPEEALGLVESDCVLAMTGWGTITLDVAKPTAGQRWTDSGEVHDDRGLKHRDERETCRVPIPPERVLLLREYIRRFESGLVGRCFAASTIVRWRRRHTHVSGRRREHSR